jgi:hypothetical protein
MWAGSHPHRPVELPRSGSNRDLPDRFEDDLNIIQSERALKHIYDAVTDTWDKVLINVIVQDAFAEGSMRTAHYMKDLTELGNQGKFVLKLSKDARDDSQVRFAPPSTREQDAANPLQLRPHGPQSYFEDVRMQMIAKRFADLYNARNPPKRVDFVAAYALELIDRPTRLDHGMVGPWYKWP